MENELVKVDAPVGELAERSLLLELGRLFSILRGGRSQYRWAPIISGCRRQGLERRQLGDPQTPVGGGCLRIQHQP